MLALKGTDGAGTGDVVGPTSSTDGNVVVFDSTTGKAIKGSVVQATANGLMIDNSSAEKGLRMGGTGNVSFVGRYSNYMSLYNHLNPSKEFKMPDSGEPTIGGNIVWHAGNLDPFSQAYNNTSRYVTDANSADTKGFMTHYLPGNAAHRPTGVDHQLMTLSYSSAWSIQLAGDVRTADWYTRCQNNSNWGSWYKLWHSGNLASPSVDYVANTLVQRDSSSNIRVNDTIEFRNGDKIRYDDSPNIFYADVDGGTANGRFDNADRLDGYHGSFSPSANTYALRDSVADIACRLLRPNFGNQSDCSGAIAFRVNNGSNNYLRFCSSPSAVRGWLQTPQHRGGTVTLNDDYEVNVSFSAMVNTPRVQLTAQTTHSGVITAKTRAVGSTYFKAIIGGSGSTSLFAWEAMR